jgi:hypothetical protein
MRLSRWTIALYMSLVFLCGGVVGGFGYRLYTMEAVSANTRRSPEEFRKRYMAEMQSRLKLSPAQVSKLETILDETRARFRATRDSINPEMEKIREDQQRQIRESLSPVQSAEYEKMREERDAEIRRRGPGQGPGGPRPPR